jgi:hypothetical protein
MITRRIITRNPAAMIRLSSRRKPKRRSWTVDEARRFLESARRDDDVLYAAYVLILVLGGLPLVAWRYRLKGGTMAESVPTSETGSAPRPVASSIPAHRCRP